MRLKNYFLPAKKTSQYSDIADQYSESTRRTFNVSRYKERIRKWVSLPTGPISILDVGCGEGFVTNLLREFANGGKIMGIDESQEMIAIARRSYSGIDFQVGDMANIFLEAETIDFVFSRFAIHYSEDLYKTLAELYRVTKPGGVALIHDAHPFYTTFFKNSFDYEKKENVRLDTSYEKKVSVIHPTFTFEEYINSFVAVGWHIQSIHEVYGHDASGEKIKPFRIPTSVYFILEK